MNLKKLNPAVDKKYLILLAGLMWCGVGVMLISIAASWLKLFQGRGEFIFYLAGFLAAMPIHHFGFLKLADKNLSRLLPLEKKSCIFSFITWKSYLIILIMVVMGITMRHSAIPKQYLSILYNGIGLGLFLSGLRYMRFFIMLSAGKDLQHKGTTRQNNLKDMKKILLLMATVSVTAVLSCQTAGNREIPFKMEDLTSPQFVKALEKAGGVCVIPLGIIEKHGPHLPLGTDLYEAREIAFTAAKKEYAVVFPPYFTGQILEARHQPGAVAYSTDLMWKMLEETCMELSRNGLKKIILLNGHGGNTSFLQYFCQAQLEGQKDYVVVLFQPDPDEATQAAIRSLKKTTLDGHAGEEETSMMYYINPALVDVQAAGNQSGADQKRLQVPYAYTGIWWYARFPNHYAGDGSKFSKELGELLINSDASQLAMLIKFLKTDNSIKELQDEFSKQAANPALK